MKIIVVGGFNIPQYDEAVARAFESFGHSVVRFSQYDYVYPTNVIRKAERRLLNGPHYWFLWNSLLKLAIREKPQVIYFRQPLEYPPWYLRFLKRKSRSVLVSYMNDDPFGLGKDKPRWRYFKKSIPNSDIGGLENA